MLFRHPEPKTYKSFFGGRSNGLVVMGSKPAKYYIEICLHLLVNPKYIKNWLRKRNILRCIWFWRKSGQDFEVTFTGLKNFAPTNLCNKEKLSQWVWWFGSCLPRTYLTHLECQRMHSSCGRPSWQCGLLWYQRTQVRIQSPANLPHLIFVKLYRKRCNYKTKKL